MRSAAVFMHGVLAGILEEAQDISGFRFRYLKDYIGPPVSLTMPVRERPYDFESFPPFFEGLLPEGPQLEGLLRIRKLDRGDLLGQLIAVGGDMVGAVTVEERT